MITTKEFRIEDARRIGTEMIGIDWDDSPFSVGRHYRDTLSASLMIGNDRIASKSASMLLVLKDE